MTKWGGTRAGAGRPEGSGKYGEPTQTVRIPASMKQDVMKYVEHKGYNLPVFSMKVPMGPLADSIDHVDRTLNLNELIKHPESTFFHPVEGDSMQPTIFHGDLAMIDASIRPMHGDVVLASIDGGLTLKRYMSLRRKIWLEGDNPRYDPIDLDPETENRVCGVMLVSIRPVSPNHLKKFS